MAGSATDQFLFCFFFLLSKVDMLGGEYMGRLKTGNIEGR